MTTEVEDFERLRPRLFSIAYRMLGSASESEDVVQDAWLRYSAAQPADLRSPAAYLTTIVTRLALDRLKVGASRPRTICRALASGAGAHRGRTGT